MKYFVNCLVVLLANLCMGLNYVAERYHSGLLSFNTVDNIYRYIRERDDATVTVTAQSATEMTLTVTDNLEDGIFDFPVTVLVPLPQGWTDVTATQQGSPVWAIVGEKLLMVDAIPDKGQVVIEKNDPESHCSSLSGYRKKCFPP